MPNKRITVKANEVVLQSGEETLEMVTNFLNG